ncbi:MAG TPA: cation diffusion facilitator family transporter [Nevskiaceae bacterium]|nr:cation diffusion facilitator family transporter [Nevskiaceae bacterium]
MSKAPSAAPAGEDTAGSRHPAAGACAPGPAHRHGHHHDHGPGHGQRSAAAAAGDGGADPDETAAHQEPAADGSRLRLALGLTVGFMAVELAAGVYSGSLALIADAGHMATDAASLALALFAVSAARRPADAQRSFGYARARVLAAFVNALALIGLAGWIAVEALLRLLEPAPVLALPMLVVASLGLLVNLLCLRILHGGHHHDLNTQGAIAHVIGDLLGSVAAIAAALLILFTGYTVADPLLSVVVAGLIARHGLRLARDCAHVLLEGTPRGLDLTALRQQLPAAVPGLREVHHLHAWELVPGQILMTLHAVVDPAELDPDQAPARIARWLGEQHRVHHVTVQVERQPCASRCEA